jgi:hypothetical protein
VADVGLAANGPAEVENQCCRLSMVNSPYYVSATLTVQIYLLFHVLASQEPSRLLVELYDPHDPNEKSPIADVTPVH